MLARSNHAVHACADGMILLFGLLFIILTSPFSTIAVMTSLLTNGRFSVVGLNRCFILFTTILCTGKKWQWLLSTDQDSVAAV